MKRPKHSLIAAAAAAVLAGALFVAGPAAFADDNAKGTLDLANEGFSVHYPQNWSVAPTQFVNSYKLVNVPAYMQAEQAPTARIKISVEFRLDHAEAVHHLQQFGAGIGAPSSAYLEIGGWPALQTTRLEQRPQPSQGPRFADEQVLRVITAVAAADRLVHLSGSLPSEADEELVAEALAIGRSLKFESDSEPGQLQRELELLRQAAPAKAPGPTKNSSLSTRAATAVAGASAPAAFTQQVPPGVNQRVFATGFGEVEIAVSPDGQNVVIGRQGNWVASGDRGQTFPFSGTVGAFDGGDPSVAIAQSGNFYYAGIDRFCHLTAYQAPPAAGMFGVDCTGMARSTNNGQTFPVGQVNPAAVCPRADPAGMVVVPGQCFPDQEHIAADRINAGMGGGDQVYSTWRNFDATDQDAGLVCSQDSGVTWTAPFDLGANSFFPRITVDQGPNGFVYVAAYGGGNYRLWKFSSCANGLALQASFPRNVVARTPIACPFAGHDRCDQNPSSQTVAVDDTNPNHVYYAYAENTAAGNDNVFVQDSTDGGVNWPIARRVQVNAAVAAQRIMPWMCTTGGDAFLTWYDRRNATAGVDDNTDYFGGAAGLDGLGNLVVRPEFQISEVAEDWCSTGWPCGTRQAASPAPGASEACAVQPQLAGTCQNAADNTTVGRCDFSDCGGVGGMSAGLPCQCNVGDFCNAVGGGCPKYGDYNGNACIARRVYAAWASAASPPGVPPPNAGRIGILFDTVNLNGLPVCDANGPYVAECGLDVALDGTGSSDPDADPLDFLWTGPFAGASASGSTPTVQFPSPTGLKSVNLAVSDGFDTEVCSAPVTVEDTLAPSITAPGAKTAECTAPAGTPVDLMGPPIVSDICDANVAFANDAPALFPLGLTIVTWTATDDDGNQATDTQNVTVADTTPPVVTASLPRVRGGDDDDDDDDGRFRIDFSANDVCDDALTVTAVLVVPGIADIPVVDGQVIAFEFEDDETEVEFEDGILDIEAPSLTLKVTATDASGNTATAEAQAPGGGDDDDDDDDNLAFADEDD